MPENETCKETVKSRIEYIDCLRGFAMFLVVFTHVWAYCFDLKDVVFPLRIPGAFHSHLFFFISGLLTPLSVHARSFVSRLQYILLPTMVMFVLYVVFFCICNYQSLLTNLGQGLQSEWKSGYWFPFVLFLIVSIHYVLSFLFSLVKTSTEDWMVLLLIVVWVHLIALKNWDWFLNDAFLCQWFSLRLLVNYLPIYILGVIGKRWWKLFNRVVANYWVIAGSLVSFLTLFYFFRNGGYYLGLLISGLGSIGVYALFAAHSKVFSKKNKFGRVISYVGENTLPIYLLHYFFLFVINNPDLGSRLYENGQRFLLTLISIGIAILIIGLCLFINALLEKITPVHRVLLGK